MADEGFAAFVWSLMVGALVGAGFDWQGWNPYFGGLLAGLATFVGFAFLFSQGEGEAKPDKSDEV